MTTATQLLEDSARERRSVDTADSAVDRVESAIEEGRTVAARATRVVCRSQAIAFTLPSHIRAQPFRPIFVLSHQLTRR